VVRFRCEGVWAGCGPACSTIIHSVVNTSNRVLFAGCQPSENPTNPESCNWSTKSSGRLTCPYVLADMDEHIAQSTDRSRSLTSSGYRATGLPTRVRCCSISRAAEPLQDSAVTHDSFLTPTVTDLFRGMVLSRHTVRHNWNRSVRSSLDNACRDCRGPIVTHQRATRESSLMSESQTVSYKIGRSMPPL
jgi:hypothetical protein